MECWEEGASAVNADECVLVVDNDERYGKSTCDYLVKMGYRARLAISGREMWECLDEGVDLVVLEHWLPGEEGLGLCRVLKHHERLAVIMTGAHDLATERIIGLEIGADDYLCKPFEPRELLARIRAVRRRVKAVAEPPAEARHFAGWRLDLRLRRLHSPRGETIDLTRSDFMVLEALSDTPNRIISRDALSRHAFGREYFINDRSVDVCISRLRQALEDDARHPRLIRTVRNEGYFLEQPALAE
ncbi:winged helix-turn-helix domain-containing protein [Halomonas sp. HNIBRBA4712]|uniref:winged helix-turn-helix domain-containing protein n=1 Tax=Halomonas sp. HNIBRBA4712 TaxID=3373087 RepID=UPI0037474168